MNLIAFNRKRKEREKLRFDTRKLNLFRVLIGEFNIFVIYFLNMRSNKKKNTQSTQKLNIHKENV